MERISRGMHEMNSEQMQQLDHGRSDLPGWIGVAEADLKRGAAARLWLRIVAENVEELRWNAPCLQMDEIWRWRMEAGRLSARR